MRTNLSRLDQFKAAYGAGRRAVQESNSGRVTRLQIVVPAVFILVGSYLGFGLATLRWKDHFLVAHQLWLWWVGGGIYFFLSLSLITKGILAAARRYAECTPTMAIKISCLFHNVLAAALMTSAAVTQEEVVKAALVSAGFKDLFSLLLTAAFLVFLHMGAAIILVD
jgi:hypothetical protein